MSSSEEDRQKKQGHGDGDGDGGDGDAEVVEPFLEYQKFEPPATLGSDLKVVRAMWFANITGNSLQDQLDSFYEKQADLYDGYRFRMLHGRPKMLQGVARHVKPAADHTKGIVWVDLAAGTGANTENFAASLAQEGRIDKVYLVDLCRPLCEVARRDRASKYPDQIIVIEGDVTDMDLPGLPPAGTVDLVTVSYALVMIPDWKQCLVQAQRLLRPGSGVIGVTDFTVAPDQWNVSKRFWTKTFEQDNIRLNAEHVPTLQKEFDELECGYGYGTFPYTPFFLKSAYFHFVGRAKKKDNKD